MQKYILNSIVKPHKHQTQTIRRKVLERFTHNKNKNVIHEENMMSSKIWYSFMFRRKVKKKNWTILKLFAFIWE